MSGSVEGAGGLGSRCSNWGGGGGGLTTTCTFNCHIVDPTFFFYYAFLT